MKRRFALLLSAVLAACAAVSPEEAQRDAGLSETAAGMPERALCRMSDADAAWDANFKASWQTKVEACNEVLARGGPDDLMTEVHTNRGFLYWRLGQVPEAMADLNEAVRLSPKHSGVYVNRGSLFATLGNHSLAEQDYRTAVDLNPENPGALNNYARMQLEQGDYSAALALMEKALALKSDMDVLYDSQAHALMGLGQIAAAEAAFGRAAALGGASRVRRYQQMLAAKGYDPGRFDGVMDATTQAALSACIRDNCRLMLD